MDVAAVVEFRNTWKQYRLGNGLAVEALRGLDLSIPAGGVFGLLGPNGSGKSTALHLLMGLMQPTAGEVDVLGEPASDCQVRRRIGFLPERPSFYAHMTGGEFLMFCAALSGVEARNRRSGIEQAAQTVELEDALKRPVSTYSKGMLQRLGFAQALVHDPDLIILDEPLSGLDPSAVQLFSKAIQELRASGKTVLLSSHLLHHMEALCDRVAILLRGVVIVEGVLEDLVEDADGWAIRLQGAGKESLAALRVWLEENLPATAEFAMTRAHRSLEAVFADAMDRNGARSLSQRGGPS